MGANLKFGIFFNAANRVNESRDAVLSAVGDFLRPARQPARTGLDGRPPLRLRPGRKKCAKIPEKMLDLISSTD